MPLEIKELIIKTTVEEGTGKSQSLSADQIESLKREIIQTCLEEVKESLTIKLER
ncbi:MAG: DUF5908 family protein [Bacteroidota bacterium]